MFAERAREYGVPSRSATWSAARTSSSSTATASSSTPTARWSRAPPVRAEDLLICEPRRPAPRRGRGAARRPRRRSTRRWSLGLARLRRARTASSASSSGSRAGSTRRWSRWSPPTRSAPSGVTCVVMPSPHSSDETQADARAIAAQPRRRADRAPDRPAMAPTRAPAARLGGTEGLAEENMQARIRGNLLMALSNKLGCARAHHRQQERDVGRLRDPLRRHGRRARGDQGRAQELVYELVGTATSAPAASWCPPRCSSAPPSAELRPDQPDEDSLPPYESSTASSRATSSATSGARRWSPRAMPAEVVERGHPRSSTAPSTSAARRRPGIRITTKAFGRDRRLPITNRFAASAGSLGARTAGGPRSSSAPARRAGPSSSVISPSQIQVVRPRWRGRARRR